MTVPRLRRNRYQGDGTSVPPHDSKNHAEDMRDFHLPLATLHQTGLHVSGVLDGLQVHGTPGATTLTVDAGVAIETTGRLIVLATDGRADLGPNPPGGDHDEQTVPVTLPLPPTPGRYCLTIRFNELLRAGEGVAGRLEQAPWLRLQPATVTDDGTAVVLAVLETATDTGQPAPRLRTLTARHPDLTTARRTAGRRMSELALTTSSTSADTTTVTDTVTGRIQAHPDGGLTVDAAQTRITGALTVTDALTVTGTATVTGALTTATRLQVGPDPVAGVTISPSDTSPDAGFVRFGDGTGWRLHFGRTREGVSGPANTGLTGVFATIQDNGDVGIGTQQPSARLTVAGDLTVTNGASVGPFAIPPAPGRLIATGSTAEIGFVRRDLGAWPANPQPGDRYVWYDQAGTAAVWTEGIGDILRLNSDGDLSLRGSLSCSRTDQPLLFVYESGTENPERPVVAHSPGFTDWGLFYRDPDDTFVFRRPGSPVMAVSLGFDRVAVGTDSAAVKFHVVGDRIRLQKFGSDQSLDMRADGSALDFESNGGELFINNNGAAVHIRNLRQGSSREIKHGIAELSAGEALTLLRGLNTVTFEFTDDDSHTTQVGFIAEETPDLLTSADKKAIKPFGVIAVLSKVAQLQHEQISELRAELKLLKEHSSTTEEQW